MTIDLDQTKAEIQDAVRDLQSEVPELQGVDLYQNKADLVDAVEAAFHKHHENEAGSLPEEGAVETQAQTEPAVEYDRTGAAPKEPADTLPVDPPYSRERDLHTYE